MELELSKEFEESVESIGKFRFVVERVPDPNQTFPGRVCTRTYETNKT